MGRFVKRNHGRSLLGFGPHKSTVYDRKENLTGEGYGETKKEAGRSADLDLTRKVAEKYTKR